MKINRNGTRINLMDITTVTKLFSGVSIGLYLLFIGWMAVRANKIQIPFIIKAGLWLAGKIYGEEFAKRERDKFIKDQLAQGRQMIIIGLIVILISSLSALT